MKIAPEKLTVGWLGPAAPLTTDIVEGSAVMPDRAGSDSLTARRAGRVVLSGSVNSELIGWVARSIGSGSICGSICQTDPATIS
jgi:hypothetical protein